MNSLQEDIKCEEMTNDNRHREEVGCITSLRIHDDLDLEMEMRLKDCDRSLRRSQNCDFAFNVNPGQYQGEIK